MPRTPDPGAFEYDLRGDHVARRRQPAYGTFMPTLGKSLGHGRSAYAHLAGSTRIHLHQLSPALAALYQSLAKKEFHPASWTGPANIPRESPLMFKSSTAINP